MSIEANKANARRIVEEMWNDRNLAVIDEVYPPSDDGNAGVKGFVSAFLTGIPDLHVTVEDQIAESDRVATRYIAEGTHLGELAGIPPTGEHARFEGIETHRFRDGRLVELWNSVDQTALLQRLRYAANRAVAARWYDDYINRHDVTALDDLVTPNFESHFLSGEAGRGAAELREIDGALFSALPDLHATIEDMLVDGDRVAVRYSSEATRPGGVAGEPLRGSGMDTFRIVDGRIAERWAEMDYTGYLAQLGMASG